MARDYEPELDREERMKPVRSRTHGRRWLAFIAVLWLFTPSSVHATELPDLSVDLHAHLFMKPGLGWFFEGAFAEPLAADSWDDRLSSKANERTLNDSGVGIMVVSLFAHPLYRMDVRDAVREQIALVQAFAAKSPLWEIAKTPAEAEALLRGGKRALVLSLEGAGGVLESEEDLREFVDVAGVRIVTPLHLVDDRFGGAATMDGFQYLANPLNLVDQLLDAHCDDGIETNRHGLTPLGERLARELAARGVWIDLTHASDAALSRLVPIAEHAGQPLLFTHTTLRTYREAERSMHHKWLARVKKSGGIVGLLPSEDALANVKTTAARCPNGCSAEACQRGIPAFATLYEEVGRALGFDHVMLGSDFNGGMRHLAASCGTKSELDHEAGFFHVGQSHLVWEGLRQVGAPVPQLHATVRAFLDAWAKVTPRKLADDDAWPELPTRDAIEGPSLTGAVSVGLSTTPHGDFPGIVLGLDAAWLKDTALPVPLEPALYAARIHGDVVLSPDEEDVPYLDATASAVGVRVAWLDNRAEAEAVRVRVRRNTPLDQALMLTVSAVGGRVRTMPGWLKYPGRFNLFLEVGLDALGYDFIEHVGLRLRPDLHGVYLVGGDTSFGFAAYPGPLRIALSGGIGAELTAVTSLADAGFVFQSDMFGGGALVLATRDGRFVQTTSVRRFFTVESDLDADIDAPPADTQIRGTFAVGF